jgi:hypothetical protein
VLLRIAWHTVAGIVTWVLADSRDTNDLFSSWSGSVSTTSPIARATVITVMLAPRPAGWCGRPRAATTTPWGGSSISWVPRGQRRSSTSAATARAMDLLPGR